MFNLRYIRQNNLIGDLGQTLLKNANILCVGAGGLGSLVSSFLISAGIGKITIMDQDTIEISNLTRQIIYREKDCNQLKVNVLAKYLKSLNSECQISSINSFIDHQNGENLIKKHDFILDCSDNFKTKYLVSDLASINKKPLISASINGFNGQVLVLIENICFRCIFPKADHDLSCFNNDVIGPSVGIIASYQANEALKLITGLNQKNKLIQIDCISNQNQTYNLVPDNECINGHINSILEYEDKINFITWDNLLKLNENTNLITIDIRSNKLPALSIKPTISNPDDLMNLNIPYNQLLVVICNYGYKSRLTALKLANLGYLNVYYTHLLF